MNKKTIGLSVATLALGMSLAVPSADAFFGGRGNDGAERGQRVGQHREMTQDRFDQLKALFVQYTDVESFREAMEQFRSEHEEEREEKRAEHEAMRESIATVIENIDNGIVKTITSDDPEVVAKIQERVGDRDPKNENVTHVVELLDDGVQITITSDDEEHVEKIQNRSEKMGKGKKGRGKGMKRGRGFGRNNN